MTVSPCEAGDSRFCKWLGLVGVREVVLRGQAAGGGWEPIVDRTGDWRVAVSTILISGKGRFEIGSELSRDRWLEE